MLRFSSNRGGDDVKLFNNKGFTLIEIVITIAVVGIVGVAFSGFFINSARIISAVDEREKAMMIAQQEMEKLKTIEFNNIEEYIDTYNSSDDAVFEAGRYSVKFDCDPFKKDDSLYKITLVNSWNDNKSLKLVTYISAR